MKMPGKNPRLVPSILFAISYPIFLLLLQAGVLLVAQISGTPYKFSDAFRTLCLYNDAFMEMPFDLRHQIIT